MRDEKATGNRSLEEDLSQPDHQQETVDVIPSSTTADDASDDYTALHESSE